MNDADFWKKYFKVYDLLNELYPYQDLANTIVTQLDIREGDLVLDVGSGTGNIALLVKESGAKMYGIDISPEGVALHQKKDSDAKLTVGSIVEGLPYADNFFDKVYSNNALYTISRDKREYIFKEMYRVLKPGGRIVVSNIREGFSPFRIYKDHIAQSIHRTGVLRTILKVIDLIVPTIKIFAYNKRITHENNTGNYDFFRKNEQSDILKKIGFIDVSTSISVYSRQAVLNKATKK